MKAMQTAFAASLLGVALVKFFWVGLFVFGYGSVGSGSVYLIAHTVTAALLLWGFALVWRSSPRWAIPVALAGLVHLTVISPVVLEWVLTGRFKDYWAFATTTATHDAVGFWLRFDTLMFQCFIPAYFFCILAFIVWRAVATRGASLRGRAHEG